MRKIEKINRLKNGCFYHQHTLTDLSDLMETIFDWELDLRQLDKGKFTGELFQIGSEQIHIIYSKINRKIEMKGNAPKGKFSFGIPKVPTSTIIWNDHKFEERRIQTYKPSAEIRAVTPPGFETYLISISENLFEKMAHAIDDSNQIFLNIENQSLKSNDDAINKMHDFLDILRSSCDEDNFKLTDNQLEMVIENEVPERLLDLISSAVPFKLKPSAAQKSFAIEKFLEYMREFTDERLTILEFCIKTGISKRTLELAVKDKFNTSPKNYIITKRLDHVRKLLKTSNASTTKIVDVANRFGFWHMGQFAKDYKLMFGELPSDTLASKR